LHITFSIIAREAAKNFWNFWHLDNLFIAHFSILSPKNQQISKSFSSKRVEILSVFVLFFNNIIFMTAFFYKELFTFSTQFSTSIFPFIFNTLVNFYHF